MEVLVLDGKNYVKASKAARDLGYATDYVGQLCRSGKVDARLIGRTWYVDPDQLGHHRVEKKRMSRVKAREQAKKAIEEVHRLRVNDTTPKPHFTAGIRYEPDDRELIPETRKLSVESLGLVKVHPDEVEGNELTIENEGEKILMSGDLTVEDVSDDPVEVDTVVLTPRVVRRTRKEVLAEERKRLKEEREAAKEAEETRFIDRIASSTDDDGQESTVVPINAVETRTEPQEGLGALADVADATDELQADFEPEPSVERVGWGARVAVLLATIALVALTMPVTKLMYYSGETDTSVISYTYEPQEAFGNLWQRIMESRVHDIIGTRIKW
ncbi:MAG TPA: hypothetical protein VFS75_02310 [Candidatus Paceibacterota bacterium]|nr:hypothetical protein [Candidatus Paceibacterota bacterium]